MRNELIYESIDEKNLTFVSTPYFKNYHKTPLNMFAQSNYVFDFLISWAKFLKLHLLLCIICYLIDQNISRMWLLLEYSLFHLLLEDNRLAVAWRPQPFLASLILQSPPWLLGGLVDRFLSVRVTSF